MVANASRTHDAHVLRRGHALLADVSARPGQGHLAVVRSAWFPAPVGAAAAGALTADPVTVALVSIAYAAALAGSLTAPAVRTLPLASRAIPGLRLVAATALLATVLLVSTGDVPVAGLVGALLSALAAQVVIGSAGGTIGETRVLVLGTSDEAEALGRTLEDAGAGGFRIVGSVADAERLAPRIAETAAQLIVHTDHLPREERLAALVRPGRQLPALDHAAFCQLALGVVPLSSLDDAWLAELLHPNRFRRADLSRRALDLVLVLLTLPFVLLVVALFAPLILLDGERTVFFRQSRVGRYGEAFEILKLRTMRGTGSDWSAAGDPRVTRVGAFLRKTHLDEVPQILNILRGEMAFVGPRPEQVGITSWLESQIPAFGHRHAVRPGITGWARVRAGYASSVRDSAIKLSNDLYYIRHRSIALDLAIVIETVRMLAERQHEVVAPAADLAVGTALAARLAAIEPLPAERPTTAPELHPPVNEPAMALVS
jgi:lipopolysaccharide/colanic/teichoic acid biosynthesis glycosyltransferase